MHYHSNDEAKRRGEFIDLADSCPIPHDARLDNSALFIRRQVLSRYLFADEIYRHIVDVAGSIMVFGVLWGQDMALFESLHGIHEPFNYTRRLIGFDTFAGFPSVSDDDKDAKRGDFSTTQNYEDYLSRVLEYHEKEAPIPHLKRFDLVKGDVCETLEPYMAAHPELIVALAYIDLDLCTPTKHVLEMVVDCMPVGGVIVFDELNLPQFPGETIALKDVLGIHTCRIRRSLLHPTAAYMVIE